MLCPNCGKELPQDAVICESCGTSVDSSREPSAINHPKEQADRPTPEIYADDPQAAPEPQKPRKKGLLLRITAIILIAVILISGVAVLGYYTFLPAKATLKTAQYLTLQKSWKQLDQALTRSEEKLDALYDTPMKSDTRISFLVDSNLLTVLGLDEESAKLLVDFINNMTLQTSTEVDMPNKKENFDISLNYLNNPILSLNGFLDNDRMGVSLPELSQKRVVGRFKDLSRLSELYSEVLPSSRLSSLSAMDPWLSSHMRQELAVDHKDIKKLVETYGMLFVNSLDSSDMSIKRGQATRIFDEETRCQEITITLDQEAQLDLVVSLLDTMRKDDTLYDVVFGNVIKVFEIMAESNPDLAQSMQGVDLEDLLGKSQIRLLLSGLKRTLTKDMFLEKVVIKAYIKGLDVVKYELEIPMATPGEKLLLSYENLINEDDSKIRLSIDVHSGGDSLAAYLDIDSQYDEKSDTEDLFIAFNVDFSGSDAGSIQLTFNSTQDPDGANHVKGKVDLSLDYQLPGNAGSLKMEGDTNVARNKEGLPENIDMIADVSLIMPSVLPEPIGFSVAYESDITYDVTVEAPDWSSSAIDLATASKEDLDAFVTEVTQTINTIMELLNYMY